MEHKEHNDHDATILTNDEKNNFDGITIDEDGNTYEDTNSVFQEDINGFSGAGGNSNFKVYTFSGMSLIQKIIIGIILAGVLFLVITFGGIFLIAFAGVALLGWIIAVLKSIF